MPSTPSSGSSGSGRGRRPRGSHTAAPRSLASRLVLPLVVVLVLVLLVVALAVAVSRLFTHVNKAITVPPAQQCQASVNGASTSVTLDQGHNAAVIVAEGLRRKLPPRAASIALATALQESNLVNLAPGEGDRDSVGLFQQRPSQGWGTAKQISDPWYAAGRFYDALVKVPNWKTGDINDVAQEVQHSGVPDGYAKHVDAARTLASSATGFSPASMSCVTRSSAAGDARQLAALLTKAVPGATVRTSGHQVTVTGASSQGQWAAAQLAMLDTGATGAIAVRADGHTWANDASRLAGFVTGEPTHTVVVTVR